MPKTPNTPIGTCPCPTKGCERTVPVFRYRQRNASAGRTRHAGKLYVSCEDHGRQEPQEFILENATIDNTARMAPPAADDAPPTSSSTSTKPAPSSRPAPAAKPAAQPARETERKGGFGFYD